MIRLGFISEAAANTDSNERILLFDLWKILEGEQKDEVKMSDLKTLIMALIKISDGKRLGVE